MDDVIVVDGSPAHIFDIHAFAWSGRVRHMRPALQTLNGKVAGVLTGIQEAKHERVIIGDDDVRYRRAELVRMFQLLDNADVVRPQNVFQPKPWHARWDTGRSLLNRFLDGDWPGTLGVRKSILLAVGGYSGGVLFENLELVRTVRAAGGREAVPLDLFIERRPPSAGYFMTQRVRQAYDEWARPWRLVGQMALLPMILFLAATSPILLAALTGAAVVAAEVGRRKGGGTKVFPITSALWAPAWLTERSITSWFAFGLRLRGGIKYRQTRVKRAANSYQQIRRRIATQRSANDTRQLRSE